MIISKAIELLEIAKHGWPTGKQEDYFVSLELGIEALKRIQQGRLHPFNPMYTPLTGETIPERGVK